MRLAVPEGRVAGEDFEHHAAELPNVDFVIWAKSFGCQSSTASGWARPTVRLVSLRVHALNPVRKQPLLRRFETLPITNDLARHGVAGHSPGC